MKPCILFWLHCPTASYPSFSFLSRLIRLFQAACRFSLPPSPHCPRTLKRLIVQQAADNIWFFKAASLCKMIRKAFIFTSNCSMSSDIEATNTNPLSPTSSLFGFIQPPTHRPTPLPLLRQPTHALPHLPSLSPLAWYVWIRELLVE